MIGSRSTTYQLITTIIIIIKKKKRFRETQVSLVWEVKVTAGKVAERHKDRKREQMHKAILASH